jgi:hypothetical protein
MSDTKSLAGTVHRLMPTRREIEDRKTLVRQTNAAFDMYPRVVRSAMD